MSLEWFEFHPKAFLTDTMRLNTEAKGAYLLLLLDYYEKEGPAPDDDDVLAAITGLPLETWARHRKVVQTLFSIEGGLWRHPTCDKVIADAKTRIANQSASGKNAARARWNKHAERNASGMRGAMRSASAADSARNAVAGGEFGPSVTAPSHKRGISGTELPENADRMRGASETQSAAHAERNASGMHSTQDTDRREGANAPSPASEGFDVIGSLIDPAFQPNREVLAEAMNVDGVQPVELAGWLDDWKQRCMDAGTRSTNWNDAWGREYHRRMQERAKARPKPKVSVTKRTKLTRLPDDWEPNVRHREIADERNLDVAACVESFADFITNKRPDWSDADAAFRNWLKSPHRTEFKRNGQAQPQRRAPAPSGSIVDAFDRLDARIDAAAGRPAADDQPHGEAAVHSLPES